jgi:hypothetical protein
MKIIEILPSRKEKTTQYYQISYESYYKIFREELKRREIIRNFSISKEEFNRIVIQSMKRETESDEH